MLFLDSKSTNLLYPNQLTMIEITIKKAKLTKSLFAQLDVISRTDFAHADVNFLGFILNVKHPRIKSNKILLIEFQEKYYVYPFFDCIDINQHTIAFNKDSNNTINFIKKEDAELFHMVYEDLINHSPDQIFI